MIYQALIGTLLLVLRPAMGAELEHPALKSVSPINFFQWVGGLVLFLLLLLAFIWGLRRLGHFSSVGAGQFQVLAAVSLGTRERAVLMQVGNKQLVLGVAPGQVQTLCILEDQDMIRLAAAQPLGDSFAARLAAALAKGKAS